MFLRLPAHPKEPKCSCDAGAANREKVAFWLRTSSVALSTDRDEAVSCFGQLQTDPSKPKECDHLYDFQIERHPTVVQASKQQATRRVLAGIGTKHLAGHFAQVGASRLVLYIF